MKQKSGPCFQCKGRLWCGLSSCPLMDKIRIQYPLEKKISREVFGPSPPNVFVGHSGWPNVAVGPLVGFEDGIDAALYDSPAKWFGLGYPEIIRFRSSLARGMAFQNVREKTFLLDDLQLAAMSIKPIDMDVFFKKLPAFRTSFSPVVQPMGPSAEMASMELAGNAAVPKKIDSIAEENLLVREALPELVSAGFDYYYLQKIFSAGILGKEKQKKLVPTRWSITAIDSMLANHYLDEVRTFPDVNDVLLYSSEYLYNHFEILLLPGAWEFEQFEAWAPGSVWTPENTGMQLPSIAHEYEPFGGRSDYAEEEGGGYYAGRFATAEALHKMRRQARVTVFREIGEGYKVPVGCWEIRENVRHAFQNPPTKFSSLSEAFGELRSRLKNPLESYLAKTRILKQKRITEF